MVQHRVADSPSGLFRLVPARPRPGMRLSEETIRTNYRYEDCWIMCGLASPDGADRVRIEDQDDLWRRLTLTDNATRKKILPDREVGGEVVLGALALPSGVALGWNLLLVGPI